MREWRMGGSGCEVIMNNVPYYAQTNVQVTAVFELELDHPGPISKGKSLFIGTPQPLSIC